MKLIKNMKMVVGLGATVAMFAIAPVVYGGITWSGIDPIFTVDGYKFNVKIEYPSQYDCDFDDEVEVVVTVPKGASTEFVSESQGELSGCEQGTSTSIEESSFSFGRLGCVDISSEPYESTDEVQESQERR